MAHHSIHWRQVGMVALIVGAAHLALGMLFLISRKAKETPDTPAMTEIWLVPPNGDRTPQARTDTARNRASPAYRRPLSIAVPSDVAPIVVEGEALSSQPHDMVQRERLGSALRHGQACRKAMMSGTTLPPDCPERGPERSHAQKGPLPVKSGEQPYWDKQVDDNEAQRRYKTEAGNTEYWQRVNRSRSDPQRYTPQE